MDGQDVLVALTVAWAIWSLARRARAAWSVDRGNCGSCAGCATLDGKPRVVVQLELPAGPTGTGLSAD